MRGVLWPGRGKSWNVGVYSRVEFHPGVSYDSEWDSEHDTSKFQSHSKYLSKDEAIAFLQANCSEFDELQRYSDRIPTLERLARGLKRKS